MQNKPIFSVVIPTYNREQKLLRALHSLSAQTFKNFEIIVCDDGSTDNTSSMIESLQAPGEFQMLRYFSGKNWGGPARPRNIGVREASAAWICFLDSDDLWHPEKLQELLPYLDHYDFIYHSFDMACAGKPLKPLLSREFKIPVFQDLMLQGHNGSIINSGVCVKKTLVVAAGGFSENKSLIGVEDADLWLKIARLTNKFKYIPARLGTYCQEGENLTIYNQKMIDRLRLLFDIHVNCLATAKLKTRAEKTNNYHLARIYQKMGNRIAALKLFHSSIRSPNHKIVLRSIFWIFYMRCKKSSGNIG